jgi:hypothetical protein
MPIHGKDIRVVALFLAVVLTGFFCLSAWAPEANAEKGKADNSTGVTSASAEEDTPGMQEQEAPAKVAKKRFPWLWVAAGVVVVGLILYFTVIKKPNYKLNVTLGAGVSGTPVAGAYSNKYRTSVVYSYAEASGYNNLKVQIDGVEVPPQGSLLMNANHTLAAQAEIIPIDEQGKWWLVETVLPKNGGGTKTFLVSFTRLQHNHGDGHVTMTQPSGESHSYNYVRGYLPIGVITRIWLVDSPDGPIALSWLVDSTEWYQKTYRGTFSGPDYMIGAVYIWLYPNNYLIQDNTWTMTRVSD